MHAQMERFFNTSIFFLHYSQNKLLWVDEIYKTFTFLTSNISIRLNTTDVAKVKLLTKTNNITGMINFKKKTNTTGIVFGI